MNYFHAAEKTAHPSNVIEFPRNWRIVRDRGRETEWDPYRCRFASKLEAEEYVEHLIENHGVDPSELFIMHKDDLPSDAREGDGDE